MKPIFPKWTNKIPLIIGIIVPIKLVGVIFFVWHYFSPKYTDVGYRPRQPIPYSHKLHAGDLGMDCRYCHSSIEKTGYADIPTTDTCMGCHKLILKDSPRLAPLREAYASDKPIEWVKVHMLPDYARFNHSVHLSAGVGCTTCHGNVNQMDIVHQDQPLSMGWCLECHANPTPHLRPRNEITNMNYDPTTSQYNPLTDPTRMRQPSPPSTDSGCGGCHY